MNYLKIIESWSEGQWHNFGLAFLQQAGWEHDLTSKDDVFCIDNKRFLVSFRHNIKRGAVGIEIEKELISRLKNANAEGFIGFYSGDYSTSLDVRLRSLKIQFALVSGTQISVLLPYFLSLFIDKYFGNRNENYRWAWNYFLNTSNQNTYKPLYCICGCQKDILENPLSISSSAAFIRREKDKLFFIYGLKNCIFRGRDANTSCGWIELNQVLHPDQFSIWNSRLNEYVTTEVGMDLKSYYTPKRLFTTRIMQRMRSVNAGFFLNSEEF